MFKRSAPILLALLGWSMLACAGDHETMIPTGYDLSYTDTLSNWGSIRFNSQSRMGTDGHLVWHWLACPDNTDCLAGGPIRFVVSRGSGAKWDAFGIHFEIVKSRTERILGQEISVKVIKATRPDAQTLYVYSPERGLLGFGAVGVAGTPFFWVEEKCGFNAANCH